MGSASVFENIWCCLGYYYDCGLGTKKDRGCAVTDENENAFGNIAKKK